MTPDHWTDFQRYVFEKLEKLSDSVSSIDRRLSRLEGKAAAIGGISGILGALLVKWFTKT